MQRVGLMVYRDCDAQASCRVASLERALELNYLYAQDAWGFRPLTLNSRSNFTRFQGRLVASADRTVVQLSGYDWLAEGVNLDTVAQKREATTMSLYNSGLYNITTFCRQPNTGPYAASGAWYYCKCVRG